MKKLMAATLALTLVASASFAQSVEFTNYIDTNPFDPLNPLSSGNVTITPGMQFDHVVMMNSTAGDFNAWELSTVALEVVAPGVFNIGAVIYGNAVNLGDVAGEFIVGNGFCSALASVELVRNKYGAFGGAPGADTVVEVWGTVPSSFGGPPGVATCGGSLVQGAMGGTDGGSTGSGATFGDGGLVINGSALVVPTEEASFGQVKARF